MRMSSQVIAGDRVPDVVAFDVVETLLSLDSVRAEFKAAGLQEPATACG